MKLSNRSIKYHDDLTSSQLRSAILGDFANEAPVKGNKEKLMPGVGPDSLAANGHWILSLPQTWSRR